MGRMMAKTLRCTKPKTIIKPSATDVMLTLMRSNRTKASKAVNRPPVNSINPVPTRLRTPSTSDIMRETRLPVLCAS